MRYLFLRIAVFLKAPFSRYSRKKRTKVFLEKMNIRGGERVIDLGGSAAFWAEVDQSLDITVVNLPGGLSKTNVPPQHKFTLVEGDACNLPQFADNQFDIAFSNSVIEHVGNDEKREQFAREARRLAPRYWVQTPSIHFPIEAHNHMPFWWYYPETLKIFFKKRWLKKLPAWTEMIEGTTVVSVNELKNIFPNSKIYKEYFIFFLKSNSAYRQ